MVSDHLIYCAINAHMSKPSVGDMIELLIAVTGLEELAGGREAVARGLDQIKGELLRVAFDACVAETRGVGLSDAAVDFDNYPALARLHAGLNDILLRLGGRRVVRLDCCLGEALARRARCSRLRSSISSLKRRTDVADTAASSCRAPTTVNGIAVAGGSWITRDLG